MDADGASMGSVGKEYTKRDVNMVWDERTVEVSVFFIWAVTLIVLIIVTAAFELGVFVGRHHANSIKQMEQEYPSENAGTGSQVEETQRKPDGYQVAEPSETAEVVQYTIQVGSFSSYNNAAALVNTLRGDGHTCWMEPESPSDTVQTVYRVFVGRFRTRKAGEQIGGVLVRRLPSIIGYTIKEIKR